MYDYFLCHHKAGWESAEALENVGLAELGTAATMSRSIGLLLHVL